MRSLLGTFVAVFSGWLAAVLFVALATAVLMAADRTPFEPMAFVFGPLTFGLYMWVFILPVWLVVLLPLYFFVPRSSSLWRWPICTACGCAAGLLIVGVVFPLPRLNSDLSLWMPYALGAIVGGVACLTGSLTCHRFQARAPAA